MGQLGVALRERLSTVLLGIAAGVAGVAGSYVAAGATPGFVAAPVEAALSRAMPGAIVTFAITTLGSLGQDLNLLFAVALVALLFTSLSLSALLLAETLGAPLAGPPLAGTAVWATTALVTGSAPLALGAGLPVLVLLGVAVVAVRRLDGTAIPIEPGRRTVLTALGGAFGFAALAGLLGSRTTTTTDTPPNWTPGKAAETERLLAVARERSLDVPELEPLVSDDFYNVDINAVDPTVDPESWTLSVTGAVETELELDYTDVIERPSRPEFVSLRCVGDTLNGRKMDNALWEVVSLGEILEEAGLSSEDCCVVLRAADDFYEEFPLEAARQGRLAYAMNGESLPRSHGAPVRALIPGHWGEINVKWLTEIEVLEEPIDGYWEKRGWHGTGPVNTVAKFHVRNRRDDGTMQIAGHAYAGTRGVSRVEVSTDGGTTWNEAQLSEPLPGEDVWRQWAHEYELPDDPHEVVVRAVEADGTVQSADRAEAYPSGAAGWVSRTVRP